MSVCMKFVLKYKCLYLVLIVLCSPSLVFADETGMGPTPIYSALMNGGFTVGGASTRQYYGPPQTDPFPVSIAGIPITGSVVKAYANWSYLTNSPGDDSEAAITINGNQVIGALSGSGTPDLCWNHTYGASYIADVTSIVQTAGGNGVYTIGSAVDEPLVGSYGEGFSMLVVWGCPCAHLREINVYSGYTANTSAPGSAATAVYGFANPYGGGGAHFFINALDGQYASDDLFINGQMASGQLAGTGGPGDCWLGALGPGPIGTNYYDHAEGDASQFMTPGDTSLTATTPMVSDCIAFSFGAISFAVPEPSTLVLLGIAGMGFIVHVWRQKFVARKDS